MQILPIYVYGMRLDVVLSHHPALRKAKSKAATFIAALLRLIAFCCCSIG